MGNNQMGYQILNDINVIMNSNVGSDALIGCERYLKSLEDNGIIKSWTYGKSGFSFLIYTLDGGQFLIHSGSGSGFVLSTESRK